MGGDNNVLATKISMAAQGSYYFIHGRQAANIFFVLCHYIDMSLNEYR
jgi:hypothetical protein